MSHLALDKNGHPVLLADVPDANVARIDPNAKSGNPAHDVHSGKFGSGSKGKKRGTPPANVDPVAYHRMLDAVRQAARLFQGDLSENNIQQFINDHAKNPGAVNIKEFAQLVHAQTISDLVDIIDGSTRGGDKKVKLSAPRTFAKNVMANLDDASIAEVQHRLEQRGNSPATIDKWIKKRVDTTRHQAIDTHKSVLAASDDWDFDFDDLELNDIEVLDHDPAAFAEAIKNMKQPEIHVHPNIVVEVPQAPPTRRIIERDEKGLAIGYRDIPVED